MATLAATTGLRAANVLSLEWSQINMETRQAWFRARTRAGLGGFRWHDPRHTWASWHAMGGTPINVLQELGGWASPQMVQRYAHLAPGHLAEYANKLRPFGQDLAIEHQAENAKIA
ncbi:MAG: tyrosine-type recombinase/integrase [Sulfuritalea sp.]|nr:tyrosine-type recombinase/integrase [Sulfuritalea sp.]